MKAAADSESIRLRRIVDHRKRERFSAPHPRFRGFEDCEVTPHRATSALAIPTRLLIRPVLSSARSTLSQTADADSLYDGRNDEFADSLSRLIGSHFLYRRLPNLEETAAIVNSSPRTVQRRLADEGMTYRRLLDRVCFDTACEMLRDTAMTIRQIAQELGYSGTNNSARSFRRITGMTPGEYRRQEIGQE